MNRPDPLRGGARGRGDREPAYPCTPTAFPPPVKYFKLDVPADISLGRERGQGPSRGLTGRGVTVAMVDTGWPTHPFFTQRGYRVDPSPRARHGERGVDQNGHGTGESANMFATAPD